MREQVVSFPPQPVITEDNLVVSIDTVIYFQVTDPRAATYEIRNYLGAVEQLTTTTLRNVVGGLNLEEALTSRDEINGQLRIVLDEATGKWGIRVGRVELKAIDPPVSIQDSMEKQMRAERDRRALILTAEGTKQSAILTAEGARQAEILRAEGDKQAAVLRAQGEAEAIQTVFNAIHVGNPDDKLLAYQYLQTLPKIADSASSKLWIIPSEFTEALKGMSTAFAGSVIEAGQAAGAGAETRRAAAAVTHRWFEGASRPRVLAHRGLLTAEDVAHGVVENSFAAVAAAHAVGAVYVESDCHLTADGTVVLFHDDDLSRVTGDPRTVAQVTAAGARVAHGLARRTDHARAGARVLPDRALQPRREGEGCRGRGRPHRGTARPPRAPDELLGRAPPRRSRRGGARRPRRAPGDVRRKRRRSLGCSARSRRARRASSGRALAGVDALQVPERRGRLRIVTPRLIAAAHRNDVEVHVWTVNDPDDMRRLIAMGVDGLVTDRADVALDVIHGRRPGFRSSLIAPP